MYMRICLIIFTLSVAACSIQPHTSSKQAETQVVKVWEYPASAFPTVCMIFQPDGSLEFKGGFSFFNGGSWKKDSESSMASIVLGGSNPLPIETIKEKINDKNAAPTSYDSPTRTIRYRIAQSTESLQFAGLIFYRKAECSIA